MCYVYMRDKFCEFNGEFQLVIDRLNDLWAYDTAEKKWIKYLFINMKA